MKAVLISIRPKWCELIANGEKTIEVRKTRPKIDTPFKCYIYQTRPKKSLIDVIYDGQELYGETYHGKTVFITTHKDVSAGSRTYGKWGKVIGEFVCYRIEDYSEWKYDHAALLRHIDLYAATNGDYKFLSEYIPEKKGFGWHISDLVIYDKPKELREFRGLCKYMDRDCCACPYYDYSIMDCKARTIKRPPQSWCYVEVSE